MIRALIVDDEALARRGVAARLSGVADVTVVAQAASGEEAVAAIRTHRPDLVFLDVQMPEMDGFGVLAALAPDEVPAVVFVTAYDEHALHAFRVHALDYLLKPIDDARFAQTLERARAHALQRDGGQVNARLLALLQQMQAPAASRFVIRDAGRIHFVRTAEVDWVEAAGDYVCLHVGARTHLLRETLGAMEARLGPDRFLRIHRSTIVNADRIRELRPCGNGEHVVVLHDGTTLKQSRSYRDHLAAFFGDAF